MYVFNALCNSIVEMQNFINNVFAKTFFVLHLNFVQIFNICIIKSMYKT